MSIYNSNDFDELVLAHLIRSPAIYNRAKKLKIEGDDFLTSRTAGIQLYKEIAELVLRLNVCPLPKNILELELNVLTETGTVSGVEPEDIENLINWFYSTDLSDPYVDEHLVNFIKHRRFSKVQQEETDGVQLFTRLSEVDLSIPKTDKSVTLAPFATPVLCAPNAGISTGFLKLDNSMGGGTHRQECGLIMAASGSGKTAVGINIAIGGMRSHNTLYISLEEPADYLTQRYYARLFQLNYTQLKNGDEQEQERLIQNFNEMTNIEKSMYSRLRIIDGRSLCPITYKGIWELIEKEAQNGFVADVVIIDQLDYMAPDKNLPKNVDRWRELEQITMEVDLMSSMRLGSKYFGMWVLHQIRGKPKWEYTYDDIAGFKGVVKPFDHATGIGRMPGTPYMNFHSLKTRHGDHFSHSYLGDLAHMTFHESDFQPPRDNYGNVIYGDTAKKTASKPQRAIKIEDDSLPPPRNSITRVDINAIQPP
jgi:hypothetical protein